MALDTVLLLPQLPARIRQRSIATTESCCFLRAEGDWRTQDGVKQRHGRGIYIDGIGEGQTYEGEWDNDMMHGRGTFRYASNAMYEVRALSAEHFQQSTFSLQRRASRAVPRAPQSARVYVSDRLRSLAPRQGEWASNVYSGHGKYTFPDGAFYEGAFSENQMHGSGSFTDAQVDPSLAPASRSEGVHATPHALPVERLLRKNRSLTFRRHHVPLQGILWQGQFYNGTGPGLPATAVVTAQ